MKSSSLGNSVFFSFINLRDMTVNIPHSNLERLEGKKVKKISHQPQKNVFAG